MQTERGSLGNAGEPGIGKGANNAQLVIEREQTEYTDRS